jgi:putative peptide zinc metalloprotease protein
MSAEPFLSPSWYRVGSLRPKLRENAQIRRHRYRDEVWYVLTDRLSPRVHRLSPSAYLFVALMDGLRTVDDIWSEVLRRVGDSAPTQNEIVNLLTQLHASDLLHGDTSPDSVELFDRQARDSRSRLKRLLLNPMAITIPLWDPDAFLERSVALARPLFGWFGALLWLAVVIPATVMAGQHWAELTENVTDRLLATENLLLLSLVLPIVKILHELGHGYATKIYGGEVHVLGVMFLMGMPTPYVDASASSGFRMKYRRALVGAAGMIVELFLAALAFYAWLLVEPGLVRAVCFNVMAIAGISTIIFNGNPLMRYDGYYILADLIEMPNLGQRSTKFWGALVDKYAFKSDSVRLPVRVSGELKWLLLYAPIAFTYRMIVQFGIALFLASHYFVVGILLALWSVTTSVVIPLYRAFKYVFTDPRLQKQRPRAVGLVVGLMGMAAIMLGFVPFPMHTLSEGVIWLPDSAFVRAGADGFVRRLLATPGSFVRTGDALFETEDPQLRESVEELRWRVEELQGKLDAQRFTDRINAEITGIELATARSMFTREREQASRLVARSGAEGISLVAKSEDLLGRFFHKGDVLGYVAPGAFNLVRVTVPQDDIELVRHHLRGVVVKLAERIDETYPASIIREVPAARNELPSKALGTAGGGIFAVDPSDRQGRKTLQRLFQFDLELPPGTPTVAFGSRVYVRFEHDWEPLGFQLFRRLRQLFLARLNV